MEKIDRRQFRPLVFHGRNGKEYIHFGVYRGYLTTDDASFIRATRDLGVVWRPIHGVKILLVSFLLARRGPSSTSLTYPCKFSGWVCITLPRQLYRRATLIWYRLPSPPCFWRLLIKKEGRMYLFLCSLFAAFTSCPC